MAFGTRHSLAVRTIDHLAERIAIAYKLAAMEVDGNLVSVAALKNPTPARTERTFTKAKTSGHDGFSLELGWVFTDEPYRGRKYCPALLEELLSTVEEPIYATARQENFGIRKILPHFGFENVGVPYEGRKKAMISLFTRPGGQLL